MRSHSIIRRTGAVLTLLFLLLAAGCTEDQVTNVYVQEDTLAYTVTGRVISMPDNLPVADAAFSVVGTDLSGTTDAEGLFQAAGLPPGSYQVVLGADGHATSRITMNMAGSKSTKPINIHRDFFLMEKACDLDLTVYGGDSGETLGGVTVEISFAEAPGDMYGYQLDLDSFPHSGVTDAEGKISLQGLPMARVWVSARAHDSDGDDKPDYGTRAVQVILTPDETVERHLVMETYSGGAPTVVASNIPEDYYTPRINADILFFVFSVPMNTSPGSTSVLMREDDYPQAPVPVSATWTSPLRLEVSPLEPLTDSQMDYYLDMDLQSQDGLGFSRTQRLYWTTGTSAGGGDCPDYVTDLVVERPGGGAFDFDDRNFQLTWSAVACAGGYRIYARDDRNNPDWVYLQDEPTDYEAGAITTLCELPPSFDRYEVDGVQTPLAGIDVTFCVVPLQAVDGEPGGSHGTATVGDGRQPVMALAQQVGNGFNQTGETSRLEFTVTFSEFIATGSSDPSIEFVEAGGDPGFVLDPADGVWIWNAGRFSGRFVFEIPPGADASGDTYQVLVHDLTDLAGNVRGGTSATFPTPITIWGATFDFEGSPQGWTATGEGWGWGTPTIGPAGGFESLRCWGVSLHEYYGNNWDTVLSSPSIVVPATPLLTFQSWYRFDSYSDRLRVLIDDGITEREIDSYNGSSSGWEKRTYSLSDYAGQTITIRFRFTSVSYGGREGFYFDDLVVEEVGP